MVNSTEVAKRFKLTNPGNLDEWYGPYASLAAAKTAVPSELRSGKTVGVITSGVITEYIWHPDNLTDAGLVVKANYATFNTYALMLASTIPKVATICRVLVDENKSVNNSFYIINPDATRIYLESKPDDNNIIINRVVATYAAMVTSLTTDNPLIITKYIVKADESNGGVIGQYTHYNNNLSFFVEGDAN